MTILTPAKRKFAAPPFVRTIDDRRDPLNLGLVGHWSLAPETISGVNPFLHRTVLDLSGNEQHGAFQDGLLMAPGPDATPALGFSGSNFFVKVYNGQSVPSLISLSAWILSTATGTRGIFCNDDFSSHRSWHFRQETGGQIGGVLFTTGGVIVFQSTATITLNRWYHVALTYDGVTGRIFINGQQDGSVSAPGILSAATNDAREIGSVAAGSTGNLWSGSIAEAREWSRPLLAGEIYQLYAEFSSDRVPYQTRARIVGPPRGTDANTVLLLHADGADSSTSFTDSSSYRHTLTPIGTAKVTTTYKKFGTGGLDIRDGSSALDINNALDFQFGSGPFTVEAWVNWPVDGGSGYRAIASLWSGTAPCSWWFGVSPAGALLLLYTPDGAYNALYSLESPIPEALANIWYHAAIDREASGTTRIYWNGAVLNTKAITETFYPATVSAIIGGDHGADYLPGAILDEVRITKGIARYAGAFKPSITPFPDPDPFGSSSIISRRTLRQRTGSRA